MKPSGNMRMASLVGVLLLAFIASSCAVPKIEQGGQQETQAESGLKDTKEDGTNYVSSSLENEKFKVKVVRVQTTKVGCLAASRTDPSLLFVGALLDGSVGLSIVPDKSLVIPPDQIVPVEIMIDKKKIKQNAVFNGLQITMTLPKESAPSPSVKAIAVNNQKIKTELYRSLYALASGCLKKDVLDASGSAIPNLKK